MAIYYSLRVEDLNETKENKKILKSYNHALENMMKLDW